MEGQQKAARVNSDTMDQLVSWTSQIMTCLILMCFQILYTKPFFVLGLLWIFDAVHAVINHGADFEDTSFLYYFFKGMEVLNLLRGFFMFVIFVCKRSVWVKVKTWWVTRVAVERDEEGHTTLRLLSRDSNNSRNTKLSVSKSSNTSAKGGR